MNTDVTRERLAKEAEKLKKGEAAYERARQLLGSGYDESRIQAFEKIKKLVASAQSNLVMAAPILIGRIAQIVDGADEPLTIVKDYEALRGSVERLSVAVSVENH